MKNQKNLIVSFFFSILLLITSTHSFAQGTVGKLYSKSQADQLFGSVLVSKTISSAALTALAQRCPQYIMFNIINGHLFVLNSKREVLSGALSKVDPSQVFHFCSASMILQLIQSSGANTLNVELRQNNMTITAGSLTLEDFMTCPPTCAQ